MYKLYRLVIECVDGGFVVSADLENKNKDANPEDNKFDRYVIPNYGKLMKALKEEFKDYKPVRKPRKVKEIV